MSTFGSSPLDLLASDTRLKTAPRELPAMRADGIRTPLKKPSASAEKSTRAGAAAAAVIVKDVLELFGMTDGFNEIKRLGEDRALSDAAVEVAMKADAIAR